MIDYFAESRDGMRNEMMQRPIIKPEILAFLRHQTPQLPGQLGALEAQAHKKGIPIIPHETVTFMQTLFNLKQPRMVLEIGTAIGFSASLFATCMGTAGRVITIDRYPLMVSRARQNIQALGLQRQIKIIAGDAATVLPTLNLQCDVVFMDSAKAKYLAFLPDCLRLLKADGILLIDDIFQGGTILQPKSEIPRRNRAIHRNLNTLLDHVFNDATLSATILPLGDGILMITKRQSV